MVRWRALWQLLSLAGDEQEHQPIFLSLVSCGSASDCFFLKSVTSQKKRRKKNTYSEECQLCSVKKKSTYRSAFYPRVTSPYSDHFRKTSKHGWLIKPVYMIRVEIHGYKSEIRGPFTELENARILHPFNLKKYSQNCESPRVENLLKSTIFPWWANGQQGAFAEA